MVFLPMLGIDTKRQNTYNLLLSCRLGLYEGLCVCKGAKWRNGRRATLRM